MRDVDRVMDLATRIRSLEQISDPDAWRENDRLRADASRILVDVAIAAGAPRVGGRGVVLRFGLLNGSGTGYDQPLGDFGTALHVSDAGRALVSARSLPSGIYNGCREGEACLDRALHPGRRMASAALRLGHASPQKP